MLLQDLTWPQLAALAPDTPVIIPIAAVEQHGHHLPLYTDSLLLGEVVRRAETALSPRVLATPLMWYGNSHHHLDFAGTLSCPPRTYLDLLVGLMENLIHHGFRRLLVINGHGGNDTPAKQAVYEVRQTHRGRSDLLLLFSTYWSLGTQPAETLPSLHQTQMGHACEWETSMILRLRPDLVGDYQAAAVVEPGNPFLPATRGWVTQDCSTIGHIGWPHLASAEKGEHLFQCFADDLQRLIVRMLDWNGSSWDG